MALDIQLVLLEPGDVELLTAGATLQLADNIFLVVPHDPKVVSVGEELLAGEKKNLHVREGVSHLVMM